MKGNKKTDIFLNTEQLGKLKITHVLVQYMYPVCFICSNEKADYYIFYELSDDDRKATWLANKIDLNMLDDVLYKDIPVQDCYKQETDKPILVILNYKTNDIIMAETEDEDNAISRLPKEPVYSELHVKKPFDASTSNEYIDYYIENGAVKFQTYRFKKYISRKALAIKSNAYLFASGVFKILEGIVSILSSILGIVFNALKIILSPLILPVRWLFNRKRILSFVKKRREYLDNRKCLHEEKEKDE